MNLDKNKKDLERRLSEVGLTLDIYKEKPPKYLRLNPRKNIAKAELEEKIKAKLIDTPIKNVFEAGALFQEEDLFHQGYYYIQDIASLMPVLALSLEKNNTVLDMCAAPGMKSCFIYDSQQVKLTCIEKSPKRFSRMFSTFRKYGIVAETINADAVRWLKKSKVSFDRILLDPSCSGEGMTTKYKDVLRRSEREIKRLSVAQLRLLQAGFRSLNPGGIIVYSTCALNRTENEGVVEKFIEKNNNAVSEDFEMPLNCVKSDYGLRILPGKTRGLFIAKIRKGT